MGGSERPGTAVSCRSEVTSASLATSIGTNGQDFANGRCPTASSQRTAGVSNDYVLRKKMAKLEEEVEQERKARLKMEQQVHELRSELSRGGSVTGRSRVTST